MLLVIALAVLQPLIQRHVPTRARVVKAIVLLAQLIDLFEIFLLQHTLQRVEVLGDALQMRRFGDYRRASAQTPS